ncbi:NAD-dependent succinate-semialdehyde dehydrogenase [Thalassotalea sp. LPB0316]|uniref:NAD-dependent succinate-semialdehyde dehydrogenase n=1 Tax=Thalassotalea sp. LPB0316 TaxID=2769490 RepID=UPI0018660C12|nr:NAD-dependent succinate-semialdehyde dehydrogenase [Thalassotalea sp. LPB0316]QOL26936.1 NAD-dependent succinate-semialdehyde dehydrogenase [Thalassotalea sp. LPB0316]
MRSLIKNQALIQQGSFINGQFVSTNYHFEVTNPAKNVTLIQVAEVDAKQLNQAVESSSLAQKSWQNVPAQEKARILRRWLTLLEENHDDLATIMSLEQGKTLADAKAEIAYGNSFVEWFSEEAKRIYGDTVSAPAADKRITVIKQPVGVVGAITPWNFPNAMITRKAAAAFAAGCSFIVKPAAETPLSALAIAYLAQQAGLPDGLFNVVVGENAQVIGEVLTTHPLINKFTFTGSTRVGKLLTAQCANTVKRVSMELGGNAPFIVFDDADLEVAINALMANKFRNCGQTCISANRIYVHESVYQQFSQMLVERVSELKQGDGLEPTNNIGCLIHHQAAKHVHQLVAGAIEQGAKVQIGGLPTAPENAFYPPTVLTNVSHGDAITQAEIFGPVLALIAFDDDDTVLAQANDTDYGLACYFFTQQLKRVNRFSEQLDYGMVGINDAVISNAAAPFGGVKQSGYGREGSKYGLDDFLDVKYLCHGAL